MTQLPRISLLNPNANPATTTMMTAIANETAEGRAAFFGQTMAHGPSIITNQAALAAAAPQIEQAGLEAARARFDGVLISGFGDPGLAALKSRLAIPVTGIAEASMAEAGAMGRTFSIVTTTPHLKAAIAAAAQRYGYGGALASIRIAGGDAEAIMSDPRLLSEALLHHCREAIRQDGAEAIVIGGGPLAQAARSIAADVPAPLIEPVAAGARLAIRRSLDARGSGAPPSGAARR